MVNRTRCRDRAVGGGRIGFIVTPTRKHRPPPATLSYWFHRGRHELKLMRSNGGRGISWHSLERILYDFSSKYLLGGYDLKFRQVSELGDSNEEPTMLAFR